MDMEAAMKRIPPHSAEAEQWKIRNPVKEM
mgnify:CR=1 FL=1